MDQGEQGEAHGSPPEQEVEVAGREQQAGPERVALGRRPGQIQRFAQAQQHLQAQENENGPTGQADTDLHVRFLDEVAQARTRMIIRGILTMAWPKARKMPACQRRVPDSMAAAVIGPGAITPEREINTAWRRNANIKGSLLGVVGIVLIYLAGLLVFAHSRSIVLEPDNELAGNVVVDESGRILGIEAG